LPLAGFAAERVAASGAWFSVALPFCRTGGATAAAGSAFTKGVVEILDVETVVERADAGLGWEAAASCFSGAAANGSASPDP
jgi:hypothetical protein